MYVLFTIISSHAHTFTNSTESLKGMYTYIHTYNYKCMTLFYRHGNVSRKKLAMGESVAFC